MAVVPDKKNEQIQFAEQHFPVWQTNAVAIGLTVAQTNLIKGATVAARAAYDAALQARQASKAATTQADNDIKTMLTLVGDAVKQIRNYAESTNNPNVFATAQIPPPADPTPALPPTQPVELRAVIESMGRLSVEWKVAPATAGFDDSLVGVLFIVRRRLGNEAAFTIVGTAQPSRAGKRGFSSFTDESLPGNPSNLQYVVQAQRGSKLGPASNVFSVSLGFGGGGMFVAATSSESSPAQGLKMAA